MVDSSCRCLTVPSACTQADKAPAQKKRRLLSNADISARGSSAAAANKKQKTHVTAEAHLQAEAWAREDQAKRNASAKKPAGAKKAAGKAKAAHLGRTPVRFLASLCFCIPVNKRLCPLLDGMVAHSCDDSCKV